MDNEADERDRRLRKIPGALALITGTLSIIIFFITENMKLFMVIVDRWTILMAVLFIAELVFVARATARRKDEDEDLAYSA